MLSTDEVYSLAANVFKLHKLIDDTDAMNAHALTNATMPNRNNFIIRFPKEL